MKFDLVNPVMYGKIQWDQIIASKPIEAVKQFIDKFFKLIVGDVPSMYVTVADEDNALHHFQIVEQRGGSNVVDYMITSFDKISKPAEKKMMENYTSMKQKFLEGGKHHSSSSSSSSSTEDMIKRFERINAAQRQLPVAYYYYNPYVYLAESIYIPTFVYPTIPHYVEIGFSTALWH